MAKIYEILMVIYMMLNEKEINEMAVFLQKDFAKMHVKSEIYDGASIEYILQDMEAGMIALTNMSHGGINPAIMEAIKLSIKTFCEKKDFKELIKEMTTLFVTIKVLKKIGEEIK